MEAFLYPNGYHKTHSARFCLYFFAMLHRKSGIQQAEAGFVLCHYALT
jgi:hypothetical protein